MENVSLTVNGNNLELHKYVRNVTEQIGLAVIRSLDIPEDVTGDITIVESNKEVSIKIGNNDIPLNEYANKMIVSILEAFVLNTSGFEPPIETIMIELS